MYENLKNLGNLMNLDLNVQPFTKQAESFNLSGLNFKIPTSLNNQFNFSSFQNSQNQLFGGNNQFGKQNNMKFSPKNISFDNTNSDLLKSSIGKNAQTLGSASTLIGSLGASSNNKLDSHVLSTREGIRSGISQLGPIGAVIAAGTSVIDSIGDAFGLGVDSLDKASANRAGINSASAWNNIIASLPGVGTSYGIFAGKMKRGSMSQETEQLRSGYSGTVGDIEAAVNLGGKKTLFGKKKANKFISNQNKRNELITAIGQENNLRRQSDGQHILAQNYNRYLGNSGSNLIIGKKGTLFPKLDEILSKRIKSFAQGGILSEKENIIAEGALHARKHNLSDIDDKFEDITHKGIPVVALSEGGNLIQAAEIEGGELVLNKHLTEKLDLLYKENSEESMIEAGKTLADELILNTNDKTNTLLNEDNN